MNGIAGSHAVRVADVCRRPPEGLTELEDGERAPALFELPSCVSHQPRRDAPPPRDRRQRRPRLDGGQAAADHPVGRLPQLSGRVGALFCDWAISSCKRSPRSICVSRATGSTSDMAVALRPPASVRRLQRRLWACTRRSWGRRFPAACYGFRPCRSAAQACERVRTAFPRAASTAPPLRRPSAARPVAQTLRPQPQAGAGRALDERMALGSGACTACAAPSAIRGSRRHARKIIGERYAGKPRARVERGRGKRARSAGGAPLTTCGPARLPRPLSDPRAPDLS